MASLIDRSAAPRVVRGLTAVVALLVVAFAASVLVPGVRRTPGQVPFWDLWIYTAVSVGAAALCLLRAHWVRRERLAWLALGLGLAATGAGDVVYGLESAWLGEPPFPSFADPLYLAFYPLAYVAMVLLARSRVGRIRPSMWLDGIGAGFAISAVVTALLLQSMVEIADGDTLGVLVALAYPVADMLLILLTVGIFAVTGWRPDRSWMLVGGALLVWGLADSIFLHQVSNGTYVEGRALDALWPIGALAIGAAAWQDSDRGTYDLRDWMTIVVPSACTLLALGVLVGEAFATTQPVAIVLAAGAVLASVGRTFLTFAEVRTLSAQTELAAWTDELTGLPNRRAVLRELGARLASGDDLALLLVDLDRFKAVNDTHGHSTGDALLSDIGPRLRESLRDGDAVGRLGGDEFAILLAAPVDLASARVVAGRVVQALERPFLLGSEPVGIGASVGIALHPEHPEHAADAGELLRSADLAMYVAKRSGSGVEGHAAGREPVPG